MVPCLVSYLARGSIALDLLTPFLVFVEPPARMILSSFLVLWAACAVKMMVFDGVDETFTQQTQGGSYEW